MSITTTPTQVKPAQVVPGRADESHARRRLMPTQFSYYLLWIGAMVVIVGPLIPIAIASVWSTPLYEDGGSFTLDNYARLFADASWWRAVRNSLLFAIMTTAGAVVGGTTVAVLVTRTNLPFRRLIGALILIPVALPGLVLILGWSTFWAPFGYGSTWIEIHTPFSIPFDLYSLFGMALVCTSVTAPIVYFFIRGVLTSLDSSLEEAARSSGAKPIRALISVTVPLLRPALLNSAVLVFALALEVLGLGLILGSSAGIEVIGTYLYSNWVEKVPADQGLVSAGALTLLTVVTVLLLVRNKLAGDARRFTTIGGKPKSSMTLDLGKARWVWSAGLLVIFAFGLIAPVIAVLLSAFTTTLSPYINPMTVLTTDNFEQIFSNDLYVESIVNSLLIATVGAAVTTVVIAVLSLVAHRSDFRFRSSLQQGMLWPRAVPGIVTGMAFFWSFAILDPSGGLRATLWAMGLAFAVRNVALAYSAFYPALAAIGEDIERAARTSGATWWRASCGIVLRLARPAMAVSFVLLFVAMLNEYDPAVFLVTPDTPVMGLTMLQLSLTGVGGGVAAFGVIQMVLTFVVLGLGRLMFGVRTRV
ncbi:ABC transporter permease [Rhodococcus opacus]|uniref:Iron ABC transporter permease n=1 Tax=Rhodococcus opacus TaxID=37919 RepID=A0A2S8J8Z0_RHOOP|nr:iron ABC transporter permease [Rhodococcus opacus]PQP23520.1 iron ABC transporter permease [Rhodococcus opacus]